MFFTWYRKKVIELEKNLALLEIKYKKAEAEEVIKHDGKMNTHELSFNKKKAEMEEQLLVAKAKQDAELSKQKKEGLEKLEVELKDYHTQSAAKKVELAKLEGDIKAEDARLEAKKELNEIKDKQLEATQKQLDSVLAMVKEIKPTIINN